MKLDKTVETTRLVIWLLLLAVSVVCAFLAFPSNGGLDVRYAFLAVFAILMATAAKPSDQ